MNEINQYQVLIHIGAMHENQATTTDRYNGFHGINVRHVRYCYITMLQYERSEIQNTPSIN